MKQILVNFDFAINSVNDLRLKNVLIILKNTYIKQYNKNNFSNKNDLKRSYSYYFCLLHVNSLTLNKVLNKIFK